MSLQPEGDRDSLHCLRLRLAGHHLLHPAGQLSDPDPDRDSTGTVTLALS